MLPIFLGDKMTNVKYCYIKKQFYKDNPNLKKILDVNDSTKQSIRTHMCLNIHYLGNNILIPLRKNLGSPNRKFGKIGFPVPSKSKPNAGLDYRYIMVINDNKYLTFDTPRISNSQITIIKDNYKTIEKEAIAYIKGYIRTANKNRVSCTAKFKESSLINFHEELKIKPKKALIGNEGKTFESLESISDEILLEQEINIVELEKEIKQKENNHTDPEE